MYIQFSLTLHRAYSSSATIVLMSPVVELVIRETRRPFRLAEDSGLDYEKIRLAPDVTQYLP